MSRTKQTRRENYQLVKQAIDNFINKPEFETFFHIIAALYPINTPPCKTMGCKLLSPGKCHATPCPLYKQHDELEDLCDVIYDSQHMGPVRMYSYWNNHKGEILLNLIRFREYWD